MDSLTLFPDRMRAALDPAMLATDLADYLAGKQAAAGYLVGQVMKLSRGKADPKQVGALVARGLEARRGGESGSGAAQAPGVVL